MPDAFALLAACAAPPSASANARVRAAASATIDWPGVLADATEHGMVPLVCRRVLDAARDALGRDSCDLLQSTARASAAKALAATNELVAVLAMLEMAGVRALPYKGPVLALDAYGDAALRESNDLDLVVATDQLDAAAAAVKAGGYVPAGDASWPDARHRNDWQGQAVFSTPERMLRVELHWRFCDRKLPWNPAFSDVLGRSATTMVAGCAVRIPELHDQLLLVLLHAARHGWDRLEPLACAAALADRGFDSDTLLARAHEVGGVRACLVGLELAHRLVGSRLPDGVSQRLVADRSLRALADRGEARVRAGDAGDARDAALHLAALDGPGSQVRYVALHVALPTAQDRAAVRLPAALAPLYLVVRVARLAARVFTR